MSKKRTSSESSDDEQTNEGSDSALQKEDNAKRSNLIALSDTTLQDLPIELLECILVKAVAMEVKDMRLAKSVWKEKADQVINRLEEVCSQWSSILTTNFFRDEVYRVLDRTAQKTSRLEILHQYPLQFEITEVTTNKDEIYLLCTQQGDRDRVIKVYDRNNMAEVIGDIQLPRRNAKAIAGCSVSSCVYVLYLDFPGIAMLRITKDEEHQFSISPWISDQYLSVARISVSATGSLIILSSDSQGGETRALVSIYNENGFLQRKIKLLPDIHGFEFVDSVIQMLNGNLIVVSSNNRFRKQLMEIDPMGAILRQYQSSQSGLFGMGFAHIYGRNLLTAPIKKFELLDSEFNLLDFAGPQLDKGQSMSPEKWHFNSARNELVDVVCDDKFKNGVLTIFRLTDE